MTATNHALTGALIGLSVSNPFLAAPLAILSHFVCDALPHFGAGNAAVQKRWFRNLLLVEAVLCLLIVITLAIAQPTHWVVAAICAFLAASPDLMWINHYQRARKGQPSLVNPKGILWFHAVIQWFERPIGAAFEVVWAASAIILLKLYIA